MKKTPFQKSHDHFLRKEWRIHKQGKGNPNEGYVPSQERPDFDESKVERLPHPMDREDE